jgi:phosphoglycerate kinase
MKYIKDIPNLNGVKVLLRIDCNVPIDNGHIVDDYRIKKILPTLDYLISKNVKIILVGHLEGKGDLSLKPVFDYLSNLYKISFIENYRKAFDVSEKMSGGEIVFLENLRFHEGEKENSAVFAKELSTLADIYINEAFAVSHRKHASVYAITEFLPSYAGILFEQEVKNISKSFSPSRPFVFIIGGAKFDTKLPLIEKFINLADKVFVGGALANNFFLEKGLNIGNSLVSPQNFGLQKYFNNPKLLLPIDVIVKNERGVETKLSENVSSEDIILDNGPQSIDLISKELVGAELVVWNGTLGAYEQGFSSGTIELAKVIAQNKAFSVIGGGDTLGAISKLNIYNEIDFVSTGGGAMLDYLANETLPAIEALNLSKL